MKKKSASESGTTRPSRPKPDDPTSHLQSSVPLDASVIQKHLFDLVSKIPSSDQEKSRDPMARSRVIARSASLSAASVSGALALPPGPISMVTILPDLLAVWNIQKQMVADIAAVHGKTALLTREMMVFCLFKHGAAMLTRDLVVRVGERLLVRKTALRVFQTALQKIGVRITQKVIAKAISRYVPFVGALAIGGYAFYDTSKVAANAIDAFSREITLEEIDSKKQGSRQRLPSKAE